MDQKLHHGTRPGPILGARPAQVSEIPEQALSAGLEPATLVVDGRGNIVSCTAAAARMFAYPHGGLPGLPVARLLPVLGSFDLFGHGAIDPALVALCDAGATFEAILLGGKTFRCQITLVRHGDFPAGHTGFHLRKVDEPALPIR